MAKKAKKAPKSCAARAAKKHLKGKAKKKFVKRCQAGKRAAKKR